MSHNRGKTIGPSGTWNTVIRTSRTLGFRKSQMVSEWMTNSRRQSATIELNRETAVRCTLITTKLYPL